MSAGDLDTGEGRPGGGFDGGAGSVGADRSAAAGGGVSTGAGEGSTRADDGAASGGVGGAEGVGGGGVPGVRGAALTRTVVLVSVASLLTDVSSEMVYPLLPFFLMTQLGAGARWLGVIEGVVESLASLLRVVSGTLSDLVRRRKALTVSGYALSVCGKAVLALAGSAGVVLAGRLIDRIGKGIRTAPRDALIAESVPAEVRGRAFGFHRAMDTTGAAAGVTLAWLLTADGMGDLRAVFAWSLVPACLAVVVLLFVRERAPARPARARVRLEDARRMPRRLWIVIGVVGLFALGNSSNQFLLLRAADAGLGERSAILLYLLYNVVYAACAYPAGRRSDRVGRARVLVAGYVLYALTYGLMAALPVAWLAWPAFALMGVFAALTEGVEKALVADLAPPALRGSALGLHSTVVGLGLLPASVAAGWLWEGVGPAAPFVVGAVTASVAAGLLLAGAAGPVRRGSVRRGS